MEEWKPVLGYEDYYEVSNFGRVCSLERKCLVKNGSIRRVMGRILKPCDNGKGYFTVGLHCGGIGRTYKIARLVLGAFIGSCPEGMESCHNDGNKQNDKLENLRWDTRVSNSCDKIAHGTILRGELSSVGKLLEAEVIKIKKALLENTLRGQGKKLAKRFEVSETSISAIRTSKTWGWLKV